MHKQSGQTLIETLVALFILTMGIGAAIGLASYSLNATSSIRKQIIAMGLAREGVEVVKNMRDTNWLRGNIASSCYDFLSGTNTASCYPDWLTGAGNGGYNLSSGAQQNFYLALNSSDINSERVWTLNQSSGQSNQFALVPSTTNLHNGLYQATGGKISNISNVGMRQAAFGRSIRLEQDTSFAPFSTVNYPLLKVTTEVWWSDRKCPTSDTPPADSKCKVVLQTYLTNWKNF